MPFLKTDRISRDKLGKSIAASFSLSSSPSPAIIKFRLIPSHDRENPSMAGNEILGRSNEDLRGKI